MKPARQTLLRMAGLLALFGVSTSAGADEGQWTPKQIGDLDQGRLAGLGLRLGPKDLWNETGGLMRAAVNLSGCSAAFISKTGLIATNHHCAYRAVQSQSTPEHDYITDGFYAKKHADELPAKGYTVRVLRSIRDVTSDVRKSAAGAANDHARAEAIEKKEKALVQACEKKNADLRCEVASFYLGKTYELHEYLELKDIRLVYAPPSAIGEYGGEVDNWMWPRHTGDFALMRAYAGKDQKPADYAEANVPYVPAEFLSVSAAGIRPGELVMVMGYPGRTERYLPASEVDRQVEQVLPATVELFGEWLRLLQAQEKRGPAIAIKVAALAKGVANREKNARGMLDGLRHLGLAKRREREEAQLADWAKAPGRQENAKALAELAGLSTERKQTFPRDHLLVNVARASNLLALAIDIVRLGRERKKPDLERTPGYMDRDVERLWKTEERRLRDFDAEVDATLLATLVERAKKQTPPFEPLASLAAGQGQAALSRALAAKLSASGLKNAERAKKLFFEEPSKIDAAQDPLFGPARKLADALEQMEAENRARDGLLARVGPKYFEMLEAKRDGPVYPDANGTLRLSIATVQGYKPQDGLLALPQTTLMGAVDKATGQPPFKLPERVLAKAEQAKNSYWADSELGDVPVCFLSNADTTGGNSGSPVVNGRGELVGLEFRPRVGKHRWGLRLQQGPLAERQRGSTLHVLVARSRGRRHAAPEGAGCARLARTSSAARAAHVGAAQRRRRQGCADPTDLVELRLPRSAGWRWPFVDEHRRSSRRRDPVAPSTQTLNKRHAGRAPRRAELDERT